MWLTNINFQFLAKAVLVDLNLNLGYSKVIDSTRHPPPWPPATPRWPQHFCRQHWCHRLYQVLEKRRKLIRIAIKLEKKSKQKRMQKMLHYNHLQLLSAMVIQFHLCYLCPRSPFHWSNGWDPANVADVYGNNVAWDKDDDTCKRMSTPWVFSLLQLFCLIFGDVPINRKKKITLLFYSL